MFKLNWTFFHYCLEPCEQNEPQNEGRAQDQLGKPSRHEKSWLITSWDDMAKLLTTCQVIPISSDEFVPIDSFLPVNFWDLSCEVDIAQCVLEELNFWAYYLSGWIFKIRLWWEDRNCAAKRQKFLLFNYVCCTHWLGLVVGISLCT